MNIDELFYIRVGSKNLGKSFENLPFVQERSMCKVVIKGCLVHRLVFSRISQVICTRILE
jgi:hypothetical protein